MRAVLLVALLVAGTVRAASKDDPARQPEVPEETVPEKRPEMPRPDDQAVIDNLALLEELELLQSMDVVDTLR